MITDDLSPLQGLPYFRGLHPAELGLLRQQAHRQDCAAGEIILLEGEPVEGLYVVRTGRVRFYRSTPEGREQVLYVCGPGDSFNDAPALDGGVNLGSAQAMTRDTSIYVLPSSLMKELMASNQKVAAAIVGVLVGRVRQLAGLAEDLSLRTTTQRVAKLLLGESVGSERVTVNTQDIASRIGTVREVVSRSLRQLELAGAVVHGEQSTILVDRRALRAVLAEERRRTTDM